MRIGMSFLPRSRDTLQWTSCLVHLCRRCEAGHFRPLPGRRDSNWYEPRGTMRLNERGNRSARDHEFSVRSQETEESFFHSCVRTIVAANFNSLLSTSKTASLSLNPSSTRSFPDRFKRDVCSECCYYASSLHSCSDPFTEIVEQRRAYFSTAPSPRCSL